LLEDRPDGPSFTDEIVKCVTISKANAFENLLEPLQKLLRLSPPIASTLARVDLFSRIGQKLHHNKAGVRLNLLRILSSICDSSEEQGGLLARYGLLDAIREMENDPAILVRDMAGKLVRSSEQSEGSTGTKRRPHMRRRSISSTPPNLMANPSRPSTPQTNRSSQSKGFLDGRETPRHSRNGLSGPLSLRPGSRDGSPAMMSGANGSASTVRNRLHRAMSNRLSQIGSLSFDDSRSSNSSARPGSAVNSRRQRQTNGDLDWT
jgi:hypothetical protein